MICWTLDPMIRQRFITAHKHSSRDGFRPYGTYVSPDSGHYLYRVVCTGCTVPYVCTPMWSAQLPVLVGIVSYREIATSCVLSCPGAGAVSGTLLLLIDKTPVFRYPGEPCTLRGVDKPCWCHVGVRTFARTSGTLPCRAQARGSGSLFITSIAVHPD